jgi:hypothetical protein
MMGARKLLPVVVALAGLAATPALADRALVIGIDRYADQKFGAAGTSSANDVAAIGALLTGALGYGASDVKLLTDEGATRDAILAAFQSWLIDGTKAGERAFFYFSGQGYFEKDTNGDEADGLDETLVPFDARVGDGDPPDVAGMFSDDELAALIGKLDGRKVTVVVDAGHSGLVSRDAVTAAADGSVRAAALGSKTRSIVVEPAAKAQKAEGAPLDTAKL